MCIYHCIIQSHLNKGVVCSPVALTFMAHKAEDVLYASFTLEAMLLEVQRKSIVLLH